MGSRNYYWVQKSVSKREWNSYYRELSSYTYIGADDDKIVVGFLASEIPSNCIEITDIERLRMIDLHRRAANVRPFPFVSENN
jgi:hypothetical protein